MGVNQKETRTNKVPDLFESERENKKKKKMKR
jgi:hypothetical protein